MTTTKVSILEDLGTDRLSIEKKAITFFGHKANKKCTLNNDGLHGKLEAGRKQGRPRTNYLQHIREWSCFIRPKQKDVCFL